MSYCYDKAVPHGHYLGGPPTWTEQDRAKNLAFALEKGERCPSCGTADWEWDDDQHAYEAVLDYCKGCHIRSAGQAQMKDGAASAGFSTVLVPKAEARRREQAHR